VNPKCERAAELEISAGLDTKRRRLTDAAPTKIADRGGDAHLPVNVRVERHAAAVPRPKLIYPDPSTLPDPQRRHAACPLERKLDDLLQV